MNIYCKSSVGWYIYMRVRFFRLCWCDL